MRKIARSWPTKLALALVTAFGLTAQGVYGWVSGFALSLTIVVAWLVLAWVVGLPQLAWRWLGAAWAKWRPVSHRRYGEAQKALESERRLAARWRCRADLLDCLRDEQAWEAARAIAPLSSTAAPGIRVNSLMSVREWTSRCSVVLSRCGFARAARDMRLREEEEEVSTPQGMLRAVERRQELLRECLNSAQARP